MKYRTPVPGLDGGDAEGDEHVALAGAGGAEPLLLGTTGDLTDPTRPDLAHLRATTPRSGLPALDDDPRLHDERSGNYAAKQTGWPITQHR